MSEWWFPKLTDSAWCQEKRSDYPDYAHLDDDALREKYAKGRKYQVLWDHLGDAYEEWEKLADAFAAQAAQIAALTEQRDAEIAEMVRSRQQIAALTHSLMNLLAVIHRDGGHYAIDHGIEQAAKGAESVVLQERQTVTALEAEVKRLRTMCSDDLPTSVGTILALEAEGVTTRLRIKELAAQVVTLMYERDDAKADLAPFVALAKTLTEIAGKQFVTGTRVTNCVVHMTLDFYHRPANCDLCRGDIANHLQYAIRVNEWLNARLDEVKEALAHPDVQRAVKEGG